MVIEMSLSSLTAAAVAAALVAAASVLAFTVLPGLFVWAAFIGWASYDHSGATPRIRALLQNAISALDKYGPHPVTQSQVGDPDKS